MLKQKIPLDNSTPIDDVLTPRTTKKSQANSTKTSVSLHQGYNRYFASGLYKSRYPKVNRHTLSFINDYLKKRRTNSHILDYGCGNGRYLTTLLSLHTKARFTAYDNAQAPLKILHKKLTRLKATQRVKLVSNKSELLNDLEVSSGADIALLLFGVLSHIESRQERHELLCSLRDSISSSCGKLILSVPNRQRRFLRLQRQQKSHSIRYTREINKTKIPFFYHLYSLEDLKKELTQAGLELISSRAESIFPESWVTRFSLLGAIDQQLCRIVPARWGYGILVSCQPSQ